MPEIQMKHSIFSAEVKGFNDESLIIEHFISTKEQDDGGDILEPEGMETRGKVVVLFQHGQDSVKGMEPIAKPISFSVGVDKNGFKGIIAKTQYYDGSKLNPPDNTGRRLYEKAKLGFMPNFSVGWYPIESSPNSKGGKTVKRWGLLEYSQVAVGMNKGATTPDEDYASFSKAIPLVKYEIEKEKSIFVKTISQRIAGAIPINALRVIHEGMFDELYVACHDETRKEEASDIMANTIMMEYVELAVPFAIKLIDEMRGGNRDMTSKEMKHYFYNGQEQKQGKADPAPDPAAQTPSPTPPVKAVVLTVKKDEVQKITLPISETKLKDMVKEIAGTAMAGVVNKLKGRLD